MRSVFKISDLLPTISGRFVNSMGLSLADPETEGEEEDDDDDDNEEEEEVEGEDVEGEREDVERGDNDDEKEKLEKEGDEEGMGDGDKVAEKKENTTTPTPAPTPHTLKPVIAVDDMTMFMLLEPILKKLKLGNSICWIDGCSPNNNNNNTNNNGRNISESAYEEEDIEYDIQTLVNESISNLSPEEFRSVVAKISDKIFKAPKTTVSLFKFLDIPSLSRLVEENWIHGDMDTVCATTNTTNTIGNTATTAAILSNTTAISSTAAPSKSTTSTLNPTTSATHATTSKNPVFSPTATIINSVNALLEVAQRLLLKNGREGTMLTLTLMFESFIYFYSLYFSIYRCFYYYFFVYSRFIFQSTFFFIFFSPVSYILLNRSL